MRNNRIIRPVIAGAAIAALTLGASGIAGATAASPEATLSWDASTSTMSLTITPTDESPGTWELYVNTPGGQVFGDVEGTSGVLTVVVPPFCGVVQGDGILNGQEVVGKRYKDNSCPPPTTTTTTTVPPVTTTTVAPPTTTTTAAAPPTVIATSSAPPAPPAGPVTESLGGPVPTPSVPASATGAPLPYTGANYPLLATIGTALSLAGLALMRRRGLRWGKS